MSKSMSPKSLAIGFAISGLMCLFLVGLYPME
jgi:hypothetical protein